MRLPRFSSSPSDRFRLQILGVVLALILVYFFIDLFSSSNLPVQEIGSTSLHTPIVSSGASTAIFTSMPNSIISSSTQRLNWNRYTNTKYNFSFEYPDYMTITRDTNDESANSADDIYLEKGDNMFFMFIHFDANPVDESTRWRESFKDSTLGGIKIRDTGWIYYNSQYGTDVTRDMYAKDFYNMEISSEPTDETDVEVGNALKTEITAAYPTIMDSIFASFTFPESKSQIITK